MRTRLSCHNRCCKYQNMLGNCTFKLPLITLYPDGVFQCDSKEEKSKTVELTRKEMDYVYNVLSNRAMKINPSYPRVQPEGEGALIWKIQQKLMWRYLKFFP